MSTVAFELRDDVAVLTLSLPDRRNALSWRLLADLGEALTAAVDSDARAAVLCGAGTTFSAGADLDELTGTVADLAVDDSVAAVTEALRACPLPVIAAVEGACVGAAVDLALACDVRIVAADGYFSVPAVALGILYSPAALERIAARTGYQTLARLLLFGERIGGADAVAAGLAARAVANGNALAAALELARGAAKNAPEASATTKAVLAALADGPGFDVADWEGARRDLLGSDARAQRVRAAQDRRVRA